jgi:malonyl-CoA decarboxylase
MKSFGSALSSVVDVGKEILARRRLAAAENAVASLALNDLCRQLLEHRGEASGMALAAEIIARYLTMDAAERPAFFDCLLKEFGVDSECILEAADSYRQHTNAENLAAITHAIEAPRQKLFRRLNMSPNGTSTLVLMRGHLQEALRKNPALKAVDSDLRHLFISWFNKGFLEMQRISWDTPASVLEKVIQYEAVHAINGWDDLRHRLREDRTCFAFFHPAMPDDPLVFVEVAFTEGLPEAIAPLLEQERQPISASKADTVVFYSISNCHPGLAGVSFGNFLIKQVVEEVRQEHPNIKTFVTLSPVPGFRKWLEQANLSELIDPELVENVKEPVTAVVPAEIRDALMQLCAHYLLREKSGLLARDPVARFHLGNGARLHRLHWAADLTTKGKQQSAGIMVNYLYDLGKIELNHEEYFDQGTIAVSKTISKLL